RLENLIERPHGIFLVTGPTGSGKSTTLYAVLKRVSNFTNNVLTLEDPIEYDLPGVNQCQINPKKGLTFATGLRSILRQDPDIIMVGEIRDTETAEMAVHAALTGHLVFSTLHTNDAPGAIARLINMGVEPFLISSSVDGVLAQRLVRRLCHKCRETFEPPESLLKTLEVKRDEITGPLYEARGCNECGQTGYKGRLAVHELMMVDNGVRDLINKKASAADIRAVAIEEGMLTLKQDAFAKVLTGETSIEELLRIITEEEVD
ncbi:GspE/PulE family protein, partial [Bdellovibrionota bacterium]